MKKSMLIGLLIASVNMHSAVAATIDMQGYWQTARENPNLAINITFKEDQKDTNPWIKIGDYKISSLEFSISELGGFTHPHHLSADPGDSRFHIYPSPDNTVPGEIRFEGSFDGRFKLPNGLSPIHYDLLIDFSHIDDDSITSARKSLHPLRASLYMTDPLGARSSEIYIVDYALTWSSVPEPAPYLLLGTAIAGMHAGNRFRRIRRIANS